jgi:hypothetical protein
MGTDGKFPRVPFRMNKNYRKCSVCPQVSQVSETVARDWQLAKAWLMRELSGKKSDEA